MDFVRVNYTFGPCLSKITDLVPKVYLLQNGPPCMHFVMDLVPDANGRPLIR